LFFLKGRAQTSLYFDKYYKVGYNNAQNSHVLLLEDSTYAFMSVVIDSTSGDQHLGLYKIDKFGNLINSKVIAYPNVQGGFYPYKGLNSFCNMSKSSLFVIGATYVNGKLATLFSKINKQTLDTIKNYIFCDTTTVIYGYHTGNIIKMNPNKFLVAGNKFDSSNQWPVVIEVDSSLTIKNIDTCLNPNNYTTYTAKYDPVNKKILFGGNKFVGMNEYSYIGVADTLGNLQTSYLHNDGQGNGISQVFYDSYDNTYVTVGNNKTGVFGSDNRYKLQICKYSTNLVPIWQKSYGFSNISTALFDATINPDGSIMAVGMYCDSLYNTGKLNYNGALIKVRGSNGDSLWMKTYDNYWYTQSGPFGYIWEALYSIEKTPEGGYIMCGTPTSLPKAKAWVIKTDSLGCELASCMPSFIGENNKQEYIFNLYPNPNSGVIYIETNLSSDNAFRIYNILGEEITMSEKLLHYQKIDISEFPNGIYFGQVSEKGKIISTQKLIKANSN
jgi:hypothetical protein